MICTEIHQMLHPVISPHMGVVTTFAKLLVHERDLRRPVLRITHSELESLRNEKKNVWSETIESKERFLFDLVQYFLLYRIGSALKSFARPWSCSFDGIATSLSSVAKMD